MAGRRLLAGIAVAAALAFASAPAAQAEVRRGDRAAEFVKVVDGRGKRVRLRDYRDRLVVLTFGASWCAPCKRELPALEKLAARYDPKKVAFLAVNIDTSVDTGKKFVQQVGLRRVVALFDPGHSTVQAYDPPKMPSVFLIDRGVVKHVHGGYTAGDENKLAALIDKALK